MQLIPAGMDRHLLISGDFEDIEAAIRQWLTQHVVTNDSACGTVHVGMVVPRRNRTETSIHSFRLTLMQNPMLSCASPSEPP